MAWRNKSNPAYEYARAVLHHWVQAVIGPIVTIGGLIASSVFQWVIPPVLWLTALGALVSWGQYLAWKDMKAGRDLAVTQPAVLTASAYGETEALDAHIAEGRRLSNALCRADAATGLALEPQVDAWEQTCRAHLQANLPLRASLFGDDTLAGHLNHVPATGLTPDYVRQFIDAKVHRLGVIRGTDFDSQRQALIDHLQAAAAMCGELGDPAA